MQALKTKNFQEISKSLHSLLFPVKMFSVLWVLLTFQNKRQRISDGSEGMNERRKPGSLPFSVYMTPSFTLCSRFFSGITKFFFHAASEGGVEKLRTIALVISPTGW